MRNWNLAAEMLAEVATLLVLLTGLPVIGAAQAEPEKGVQITLAVYSGRPNPEWWLTSERDYRRLVDLVTKLKPVDRALFNYDEWNRLGYASFWITPKAIQGLPHAVHVWQDMALVQPSSEGKALYATDAAQIYDLLVAQAERRGHGKFFANYRKKVVK